MKSLRSIVYFLKRLIHHNPVLYRPLYFLATFNLDYARQLISRKRYPSRFGGMWTDASPLNIRAQRTLC